ncbi:MAG: glycoside hydrolase family 36 protein, partial [Bacillota bacterium]
MGAVEAPDGRVLLLGALGVGARVEADEEVLRGFFEEGSGEQAEEASPDGWFVGYGDPVSVFARYAELLGERLGKRGAGSAPRVWCSWYSFYRDISAAQMAEVLQGLQGLAFDVFQIDDGWQREIGEWEANERFPSGMAAMAERIRRAGFKPGLWIAPFIVAPRSRLYREHPEWLLKDADGRPAVAGYNWGDYYYALDTTRPEVGKWLGELIR